MMQRMIVLFVLTILISGCTTTSHRNDSLDTQIQDFQTEIAALKNELQQKNEQISSLENQIQNLPAQEITDSEETSAEKSSAAVSLSPKKIQTALKNAGFYNGKVDGKIGRQTKKAIKNFQREKGLTADGVAGKATCQKLKKYLD